MFIGFIIFNRLLKNSHAGFGIILEPLFHHKWTDLPSFLVIRDKIKQQSWSK